MSDNDDNKKRRPLKSIPPEGFPLKMILFWVVGIGVLVALLYLNPGRTQEPARLKIQQVVELAEQGQITDGTIRPDGTGGKDWSEVTGKIKSGTPGNESSVPKDFIASGRLTDASLERLQKTQAFTEKPATTVLTKIARKLRPTI